MEELRRRQLLEPVKAAISKGTPYLGICLGLQLLFEESEESPGVQGLGILQGRVRRFPSTSLKIPHMGWNQVVGEVDGCPVLRGIPVRSYVYFVHSYYADPADRSLIILEAEYGIRFAAMVWRDNLFATQFHPEKSQALGLRLLQNFVNL